MKVLTTLFSALLLLVSLAQVPAQAAMIATNDVVANQQAQANRDKVRDFLTRASVQEQLRVMGVDAALARSRVDSLTAQEVASLAQRIDSLPAGGALSTTDVIIILLVAILVAIAL
ncbi:PA2779 family protein [Pseudomonas sp. UL073]|uniref:PA2779 family protein n=1 Tax=Zestomonas insulae TaxID=2809017 RepID=A0ABS2ICZ5_9GAMM|nr:PA2779 family protein [Pseudomonas insulae]MBM7060827.1 PA2779 family protein [Pseudomonas insulae]